MLLPALKELMLTRRLKCSWQELQDMPELTVELWEAILEGEDHARLAQAAAGAAG